MRKKRTRKRRAKNRRKTKRNTGKGRRVARARVTPLIAAVMATQTQTRASPRVKREGRRRKRSPVGITALTTSGESRVRKRPPLTEAGHRAPTPDISGPKRSLEIIDKEGQRGDGAGVGIAARRTRSGRREVKREGGAAAGAARLSAAPRMCWTEVGAAREAGRTEVKTDVTVETVSGAEEAQEETKAGQLRGGAEAERGEKKERADEGAGAQRGAEESTDISVHFLFTFLLIIETVKLAACCVIWFLITVQFSASFGSTSNVTGQTDRHVSLQQRAAVNRESQPAA